MCFLTTQHFIKRVKKFCVFLPVAAQLRPTCKTFNNESKRFKEQAHCFIAANKWTLILKYFLYMYWKRCKQNFYHLHLISCTVINIFIITINESHKKAKKLFWSNCRMKMKHLIWTLFTLDGDALWRSYSAAWAPSSSAPWTWRLKSSSSMFSSGPGLCPLVVWRDMAAQRYELLHHTSLQVSTQAVCLVWVLTCRYLMDKRDGGDERQQSQQHEDQSDDMNWWIWWNTWRLLLNMN